MGTIQAYGCFHFLLPIHTGHDKIIKKWLENGQFNIYSRLYKEWINHRLASITERLQISALVTLISHCMVAITTSLQVLLKSSSRLSCGDCEGHSSWFISHSLSRFSYILSHSFRAVPLCHLSLRGSSDDITSEPPLISQSESCGCAKPSFCGGKWYLCDCWQPELILSDNVKLIWLSQWESRTLTQGSVHTFRRWQGKNQPQLPQRT